MCIHDKEMIQSCVIFNEKNTTQSIPCDLLHRQQTKEKVKIPELGYLASKAADG